MYKTESASCDPAAVSASSKAVVMSEVGAAPTTSIFPPRMRVERSFMAPAAAGLYV